MKVIYFVRHGEALDDVEDRYGGWADDPLTKDGLQTARILAKKITSFSPKPKKIYSSPFKRALETAEIIGSSLKLQVIKITNLKERNRYGILTSMTKTEARKKHPDLVVEVEDYLHTITGAETYQHYRDRVLKALKEIFSGVDADSLVVCHGGTFRVIMWELLGRKYYKSADLNAFISTKENEGKLVLKKSSGLKFNNKIDN